MRFRRKKKEKELNYDLLNSEQREFLEREEKIDKINSQINRPLLMYAYIAIFLMLALIVYLFRFMITQRDTVIANAANPRLDEYAANVDRGEILTSDGEVIAETKNGKRYYPYGSLFAHVGGYDKYTKAGLELVGNYYLSESHANIVERTVNSLREEKNKGDKVVSTLNLDIQKTASEAMGSANGAVVVMEPGTGKILAMVSKPDFDPNDIDAVWKEANDENSNSSMLLNRATQGLYPPGSTFKIMTSLAYMRQNPTKYKDFMYDCTSGSTVFNGVSVHCYDNKTHGNQNIEMAMANSCNKAFSQMGTELDVGKWRETMEEFLFNKNLPYTDSCAISKFVLDSKSDSGYIPQTAFGQGDTLITPLHNAMIMSTIANGGVMMKPYFIDSIENYKGNRIKKFSPDSYGRLMTEEEVDTMLKYLRAVVTSGTAAPYFSGAQYEAYGKTGTAEYSGGEHDYSWFVGYTEGGFNSQKGGVVVSIVIEESDVNNVKASAVARRIMDEFYLAN